MGIVINTLSNFALGIFVLSMQWVLIWFVNSQVTKMCPRICDVGISLLVSAIGAVVLGSEWVVVVLPFLLICGYLRNRELSWHLIYFYGAYTTFISLLLLNLTSLLLYLLVPGKIYHHKVILMLMTIVIPILFHLIVTNVMKIDFATLTVSSDFVEEQILRPTNIFLSIGFFVFLVMYYIEQILNSYETVNEYTKYIFFVYFFLLFSLLAFLALQVRSFIQQEIQNVKTENYEQALPYYLEIERLYRELSGFRHDFANMMITFDESIKTEDISNIKTVYEEILKEAAIDLKNTKFEVAELSNIGNTAVKSVLSAKVLSAQHKNIEVSLEIKEPISRFYIDTLDYVRVISNLIDNAIEGAELAEKKSMNIAIFLKDKLLFTRIENTRVKNNLTTDKMFALNYSTKGTGRGRGLNNVQRILQKYSNTWTETKINDDKVVQIIIIKEINKNEHLHFRR